MGSRAHLTLEHRAKISEANRHRHHSAETRRKLSQMHLGAGNPNFGKPLSVERKTKLSALNAGTNNPNFGRHHSVTARNRISESRRGKHLSPETRAKIGAAVRGERHPNWQGGLSMLPYSTDWTESLRRSIRERDHYACRMCGKQQGDEAFPVHHINYDKAYCDTNNLITLCVRCHNKTNWNRPYWTMLFQFMMEKGV